jgi:hypothetical protein
MKKLTLIAAYLSILVSFSIAQTEETGKNELTVWGGISPDSNTFVPGLGGTRDARFGMIAFQYSRRFNNNDTVNLKYTADFVPAAFLNYRDVEILPTMPPSAGISRQTRYAWGVTPLGLQINFRPRRNVQPFVTAAGGMLYFTDRTPAFSGTHFNFTADVGGGLEFKLKNKRALSVGYKYFHISNGFRGISNPGFDNNLVYIGYTFFSK